MDEPLAPEEAIQIVRSIAKLGTIELSGHCRERMRSKNFDYHDLMLVLSNGEIKEPPEYDEEHDHYKYKVTGPTIDCDNATAVTVILDHRSILVITIFGIEE